MLSLVTAALLSQVPIISPVPQNGGPSFVGSSGTCLDLSGGAGSSVICSDGGTGVVIPGFIATGDAGFYNVKVGNFISGTWDAGNGIPYLNIAGRTIATGTFSVSAAVQAMQNGNDVGGSTGTNFVMAAPGKQTNVATFYTYGGGGGRTTDMLFLGTANSDLCWDGNGSDSDCTGAGIKWLVDTNGNTTQAGTATTTALVVSGANAANVRPDKTTCTMSTTTCTHTVISGTACICQDPTHAYAASCSVSSTTATCTSGTSNTDTWNIFTL